MRRICMGNENARVALRPVTELDRVAKVLPSAAIPDNHPAYVLATLLVAAESQGQGLGRSLLYRAASTLVRKEGQAWLGLMTDNFKTPPGRTREDIRAVWDAFVAEHPTATVQDGFILLTSDLDLEG